jgi:hypothetical protein
MIRQDNRHAITDACVRVHRQAMPEPSETESTITHPVRNISRGGLRFYSHHHYRLDERIEITVQLANSKTHSAMGRICYRNIDGDNGYHYGISFLNNFLEMAACR